MSETLPEQDCLFPDFTQKCANYVNFEIASKQRNLSANTMFTTFTSLNHTYLIITSYNNYKLPRGRLGNFTKPG